MGFLLSERAFPWVRASAQRSVPVLLGVLALLGPPGACGLPHGLSHMQNRPGFPPPLRTECVVTIRGKYFFEPGPTKAGLDANDGVV